jgi:hypothetical protein
MEANGHEHLPPSSRGGAAPSEASSGARASQPPDRRALEVAKSVATGQDAASASPVVVARPATVDMEDRLDLVADCEQLAGRGPARRAPRNREPGGGGASEAGPVTHAESEGDSRGVRPPESRAAGSEGAAPRVS